MKISNKVILLIPHYNNIKGLKTSLLSIGNEEKIDVLIIDDGSESIIDEEEVRMCFLGQGNVSFIYLKENKGIEIALNTGLKYILDKKYELTSRLDCGDICVKDRFKQQQSFLEKNKDIVLVGSNVNFVDTSGNLAYVLKVPEKDKRIRKKMFINAMHIHPTIMFRNKILESTGLYPVDFKAAEDYAFFFNILKNYKVSNINKVLVSCEINENGISSLQRKSQMRSRIKIISNNFYFGIYPIYGLLRSIFLYIVPLKLLIKAKKIIKN